MYIKSQLSNNSKNKEGTYEFLNEISIIQNFETLYYISFCTKFCKYNKCFLHIESF